VKGQRKASDALMKKEGYRRVSLVAQRFGVSRPTIYNWLYDGKIFGKKVEGVVYVHEKSVEDVVQAAQEFESESHGSLVEKGFLSVSQAAKKYPVTRQNIYAWIHGGKVEAQQADKSGHWYVLETSISLRCEGAS